jgi:hypothetical protein
MKPIRCRTMLFLGLTAVLLAWNGDLRPTEQGFVATADAVIGRPLTPVSYAGVARRTTVRVAMPGVGAPGVGVRPANRGGPVNRVGVR